MTGPAGGLVTIEAIQAAATTLRGVAVRTPLIAFGDPGDRRWLKAESLQPIGAFKIRGAYVAVASLTADQRARGVITYSSGNHAQGVARAARLLGAPAVVVMPSDAPAIKRERVAADGAEIVVVGTASDERQQVAESLAAERGLSIIPPFDDDRIIAGQGTVGLELVEDLADLACVLVPVGGGGLASGVATAIKALRPDGPGDRRRIGARGRRAGIARARRDRPLAGRARLADDRRRHANAVARPADVRPPARAPRRDRDGHRGGDRRCRAPGRRAVPAGRRAVGRPEPGGDGIPRRRARPDGAGRIRGGRDQRRQRRSRPVPRAADVPGPGARASLAIRRAGRRARWRAARPVAARARGSGRGRPRPGGPPGPCSAPRPASSRRPGP